MHLAKLKQFSECNGIIKLVTVSLSWISEVTVLQHSTVVFLYSSCEEESNNSVSNLNSDDKLTPVFHVSVGCAELYFL
jgi:hypothetical protein